MTEGKAVFLTERGQELVRVLSEELGPLDRAFALCGLYPEELKKALRDLVGTELPFLNPHLPFMEKVVENKGWTVMVLGLRGKKVGLIGVADRVLLATGELKA